MRKIARKKYAGTPINTLEDLANVLRDTNDVTITYSCSEDDVQQVSVAIGDSLQKRKTMIIGTGRASTIRDAGEACTEDAKKFLKAIEGKVALPKKIQKRSS